VAVTWVDRRVNSHTDNPANSVARARPSSMAVAATATYLPVVGLTCLVLMYCDGSPTTESVTVPGQRLLLHRREIESDRGLFMLWYQGFATASWWLSELRIPHVLVLFGGSGTVPVKCGA
jgi:uncharacterized iron-regulated membrane protein